MPSDLKSPKTLFQANPTLPQKVKNVISEIDPWVKRYPQILSLNEDELDHWISANPSRRNIRHEDIQTYKKHLSEQTAPQTVVSSQKPLEIPPLNQIRTPEQFSLWLNQYKQNLPEAFRKKIYISPHVFNQKAQFYPTFWNQISTLLPPEELEKLNTYTQTIKQSDIYPRFIYWRNHLPAQYRAMIPDDFYQIYSFAKRYAHQEQAVGKMEKVFQAHPEQVVTPVAVSEVAKEHREGQREVKPEQPQRQEKPKEPIREEHHETTPEITKVYSKEPYPDAIEAKFTVSNTQAAPLTQSQPPPQQSQDSDNRQQQSSLQDKYNHVKNLKKNIENAKDTYNKAKNGVNKTKNVLQKGRNVTSRVSQGGKQAAQKGVRALGRGTGRVLSRIGLIGGGGTTVAGGIGGAGLGIILFLIFGLIFTIILIVLIIYAVFFTADDRFTRIIVQKTANKEQIPNPEEATQESDTHITYTISTIYDEKSSGISIVDIIPDNAEFVSAEGKFVAYDSEGRVVADPNNNTAAVRKVVWEVRSATGTGTPAPNDAVGSNTPLGWPMNGNMSQGPQGPSHRGYYSPRGIEPVDIWASGAPPTHSTFTAVVKTAHYCDTDGTCECYRENDGSSSCPAGHGYGSYVDLAPTDNSFFIRYGHLSRIDVTQGANVIRGDVVGLMGATGYVTGPHLHWEFRGIPMAPPYIPEPISNPYCNGGDCSPQTVTFDPNLGRED